MSARKIVTSGASEIVVDDFIDTYLRERPKTIPELSLHQPPEPPPPATPPAPPAQASRFPRATRRGLGEVARPPQPATPKPAPAAPVARASAPRPQAAPTAAFEAPDTTPDSEARATLPNAADDGATARRLLAARDERISQLENELKKVRDDLERVRRDSDADADQRTQIVRSGVSAAGEAPTPQAHAGAVWRPAPPPRPGTAGRAIPPMVRTLPMAAVAPNPPTTGVGSSAPSPPSPASSNVRAERPDATMLLAAVTNEPSVATSAPSSKPEAPRAAEDNASPTMVLGAVPDFGGRSEPPPGLEGYVPLAPAPPPPGSSGLTPAPFEAPRLAPTGDDAETIAETIVRAPKRNSRAPAILALVVVVGAGASATFAYLRGMGPFAAHTKSASVTASAKRDETVPAKASATRVADPSPATSVSAAPTPSSASAPATSAAPVVDPPVAAPADKLPDAAQATPDELRTLLSFQAFLTVRSTVDAAVVLQGQDVGRTNQRVVVRCGPKNIRLRGPNAEWLSEGVAAQLTCMQHVIVDIPAAR